LRSGYSVVDLRDKISKGGRKFEEELEKGDIIKLKYHTAYNSVKKFILLRLVDVVNKRTYLIDIQLKKILSVDTAYLMIVIQRIILISLIVFLIVGIWMGIWNKRITKRMCHEQSYPQFSVLNLKNNSELPNTIHYSGSKLLGYEEKALENLLIGFWTGEKDKLVFYKNGKMKLTSLKTEKSYECTYKLFADGKIKIKGRNEMEKEGKISFEEEGKFLTLQDDNKNSEKYQRV